MKDDNYNLEQILPHSKGMILIDKILEFENESIRAVVNLHQKSKFMDESGRVNAWVGIEYMAQAIAAWSGIQARLAGRPVSIGFLLGTRRYTSSISHFNCGDKLIVDARRNYQDENLAAFDCGILVKKTSVISARLTVYRSEMI